jgi:F-type H+-transporting ATPase subunit delta
MIPHRAAHRYALALIQTMENNAGMEVILQDMRNLREVIVSSRDMRVFLQSPVVNKEKKKSILTSLLTGKISKPMLDFIILLCEKRRENIIPLIIQEFNDLCDLRMGIIRPRVTSAIELSEKEKKSLEAQLNARYNKRIDAVYSINKDIRGGIVVQVGDTITDGSVTHQLETLRKRMYTGVN